MTSAMMKVNYKAYLFNSIMMCVQNNVKLICNYAYFLGHESKGKM